MATHTAVPAQDALTQVEAEERAGRLSNASYDIAIELRAGAETYGGDVTMRFDLSGDADLFLEFRGRRIERLEINGDVADPAWRQHRITLPGAALGAHNVVRMVYENAYDRTGDGFHHYVDPEDGEEYLYTNFEPYDAHRLFPCFDQPDIKADYRLTVVAPSEWLVVGNAPERSSEPVDDGRLRHVFESTPRFSTYLFALVAGPLHAVYRDHGDVRLGVFCRRALARHLDGDEIFTVTAAGIDFFSSLFDTPYRFTKYDQLFCPEFNIGAMENVGAVTISERYIFRDPATETQRKERAELILHELAHMWFGNLVTLRWWNDLWLNETFATYVSFLAIDEATRFAGAWKSFAGIKRWAYRQDALVTTHPISTFAPDTDAAFLNFDGITYGKGAAVMKQLVATIGRDGFEEGLHRYFRRHEFGNATLADFIGALEEGSRRDLGRWSRLWLETASLNTLAAEWTAQGGSIRSFRLTQTAPKAYPTLRPHAVEIALGRELGDGGLQVDDVPASIEASTADVPDAVGRSAPAFVFPNHNDHAYARVALDPVSLDYARRRLEGIRDPLLRALTWLALWEMVRDRQLSSIEYLDLALGRLCPEPDLDILSEALPTVHAALAGYVPERRRETEAHRFFGGAVGTLAGNADADGRLIWTRALINVAATSRDAAALVRLADGEERIEGVTIDQEMRWSIAVKAAAFDLPGALDRLAAERARDPSDRADRADRRAEAARPDAATKEDVWNRIAADRYPSLQLAVEAMQGFNWAHQADLLEPYVDRYFAVVADVFEHAEQRYAVAFARNLFPAYRVDAATLERSEALVTNLGERLPSLTRVLREANDDLARAIACRAFADEVR
ncbi:MAG: aminopeptidase N [Candidatus Limnocylindria bacterium]